MKFQITNAQGEQHVLETDKSHSQLLSEFSPTTDIQPIYEAAAKAVEEVVAAPVKKRIAAQGEGDK